MERITEALLEREVLDGKDIQLLIDDKPLPEKELTGPPPTEPTAPAVAGTEEKSDDAAPGFAEGPPKPSPA